MTTKQQADLDEIAMELAEKVMADPGRFGPQHQARIQNAIREGMERVMSPGSPRLIRATAELPDGRTVEVEWPEPVRERLEVGEEYWITEAGIGLPQKEKWEGLPAELQALSDGRIHLTREAALQHDRAITKLNGGEAE